MDERSNDDVRALFTQVGCIMEDASVVALIWDPKDAVAVEERFERLSQANQQIEEALQKIKTLLEIT